MNADIKNKLVTWFKDIVSEFPWLTIRYEFSEKLGVFLVGYYPSDKIDQCNEFCHKSMNFEDGMRLQYGDDAPLFGNEEDCFVLSECAACYPETSHYQSFANVEFPQISFVGLSAECFEQNEYFSLAA